MNKKFTKLVKGDKVAILSPGKRGQDKEKKEKKEKRKRGQGQ